MSQTTTTKNSLDRFSIWFNQTTTTKNDKKSKKKIKSARYSRNPKNPPLIPEAYSSLYSCFF